MEKIQTPQFILTVMILIGFAGLVVFLMMADVSEKNADVVKTVITSMGTACLLSLGFWFGPTKKD